MYLGKPIIAPESNRADLSEWASKYNMELRNVSRPRTIQLKHIRDFQNQEDVDYCTEKHLKQGHVYKDLLAKTDEFIPKINNLLGDFSKLMESDNNVTVPPTGMFLIVIQYNMI